jgi:hypothetical protein
VTNTRQLICLTDCGDPSRDGLYRKPFPEGIIKRSMATFHRAHLLF